MTYPHMHSAAAQHKHNCEITVTATSAEDDLCRHAFGCCTAQTQLRNYRVQIRTHHCNISDRHCTTEPSKTTTKVIPPIPSNSLSLSVSLPPSMPGPKPVFPKVHALPRHTSVPRNMCTISPSTTARPGKIPQSVHHLSEHFCMYGQSGG